MMRGSSPRLTVRRFLGNLAWPSALLVAHLGFASPVGAQNQDATSLPGEDQLARSTSRLMQGGQTLEVVVRDAIPSEAILAGRAAEPTEPPVEEQADVPSRPDSNPARPGEHILARQVEPAADRPAPDDRDNVQSPGFERPWPRLEDAGHTQPVQDIAVTADGRWAVSGGEDKVLHVWQRDPQRGWFHRRTIAWQIERSTRGRIYQVAVKGTRAAIAGHGAMGSNGEIWIVDIETGQWLRTLDDPANGHRQIITKLAWAPGATDALASADVEGTVMLWQADPQGRWSGRLIVARDDIRYGPETAQWLQQNGLRNFSSLAFLGSQQLVIPTFQKEDPWESSSWHLERFDFKGKSLQRSPEKLPVVLDLQTDDAATRMVTLTADGIVRWWEVSPKRLGRPRALPRLPAHPIANGLSLDRLGNRLVVCDIHAGVELWRMPANPADQPQQQQRFIENEQGQRCSVCFLATDAAGNTDHSLWIGRDSQISVYPIDLGRVVANRQAPIMAEQVQVLSTESESWQQIRFTEHAGYRLTLGTGETFETWFDFETLQPGDEPENKADPALERSDPPGEPEQTPGQWRADVGQIEGFVGQQLVLSCNQQPRAVLPLNLRLWGGPSATAVVAPGPGAAPQAANQDEAADEAPPLTLAIGFRDTGNILICELPQVACPAATDTPQAPQSPQALLPPLPKARLLRFFRGHSGTVLALAASDNGRYLASSSSDGTIGIWPIAGVQDASTTENRWGLEVQQVNNTVLVRDIREDGPLYFRGLREGDQITELTWIDPQAGTPITVRAAAEIAAALESVDAMTQVKCVWQRRGQRQPIFQSFPAWQPLAQAYIDRQQQWAMWTPAGIYDASINGGRLFGWQVNRGPQRLPDFYRADQFRKRLERPDVMRQLLRRGSLTAAMLAVDGKLPQDADNAIRSQIQAQPRIAWIDLGPEDQTNGNRLVVQCDITLPVGSRLEVANLFADGVPAVTHHQVSQRLITHPQRGREQVQRHRWEVPLVNRSVIPLEIITATEAGAIGTLERQVQRPPGLPAPAGKPQLHVLSMGVNQYRDPGLLSLDFATNGAQQITKIMRQSARSLYDVSSLTLLDDQVNRGRWRLGVREIVDTLRQRVAPDDLVMIYVCGHGIRDPGTGSWYFVTADARFDDLMQGRYHDCLALDDFQRIAALACRKLILLDTCHSGAAQSMLIQKNMRPQDFKKVLQTMNDQRLLTITASEGHQEATEEAKFQLGRFTARVTDALSGKADLTGNRDQIVSVDELFQYVKRKMAEDEREDGFVQRPTVSPWELYRRTSIGLTQIPVAP